MRFPAKINTDHIFKNILQIKLDYPDIIFRPADKNIGTVALTLSKYDDLVMDHLNNLDNYRFITNNENSLNIINSVKNRLSNLLLLNDTPDNIIFTASELKFINSFKNPKIPHFYVLPKLHKTGNLKGRPICSSLNWWTTPIAIILDIRLQEFIQSNFVHSVKNSFSIVKDLEY